MRVASAEPVTLRRRDHPRVEVGVAAWRVDRGRVEVRIATGIGRARVAAGRSNPESRFGGERDFLEPDAGSYQVQLSTIAAKSAPSTMPSAFVSATPPAAPQLARSRPRSRPSTWQSPVMSPGLDAMGE